VISLRNDRLCSTLRTCRQRSLYSRSRHVSVDLQLDRRTSQDEPWMWSLRAQPRRSCGTFVAHKSEKILFSRVNQRQRTTHETTDPKHSERVSVALLIRRSSVRARRGPPRVCAVQRLRSAFTPYRTVPERRAMWHILCRMVRGQAVCSFQSVGRRFEPCGAKRCLRRSAAWARRRDPA
jgi:hypothetical protein